ncbi:MAG: hypothetical protein R2764_03455 [Bacteroidales bacterium]
MDYYKPMQHLKKITNDTEIKSTFYVRLNQNETLKKMRTSTPPGQTIYEYWITLDSRERPIYDYSEPNVLTYTANYLVTVKIMDTDGNVQKGIVTNNSDHAE